MTENISTEYLSRCIQTLEKSYTEFLKQDEAIDPIAYDIYRNSVVKAFEMTIEQSGKLMRKVLKPYFATHKQVYALTYKQIFKMALQHGLLEQDLVERWFTYRDNRNATACDYGVFFATKTVLLIEQFILDAKVVRDVINTA